MRTLITSLKEFCILREEENPKNKIMLLNIFFTLYQQQLCPKTAKIIIINNYIR